MNVDAFALLLTKSMVSLVKELQRAATELIEPEHLWLPVEPWMSNQPQTKHHHQTHERQAAIGKHPDTEQGI